MTKEKGAKTNDKEIKNKKKRQNKDYHATKETLRKQHERDGMNTVEKGTNEDLIKLIEDEIDECKQELVKIKQLKGRIKKACEASVC